MSVISKIILVLLLISSVAFQACKKPEEPIGEISVDPKEITVYDSGEKNISLALDPLGTTKWSVSKSPEWINVIPAFGTIENNIPQITIKGNPGELPQGRYNDTVHFEAENAGVAALLVQLVVNEDSENPLALDHYDLHYQTNEWEKQIKITNISTEDCEYKCSNVSYTLEIDNSTGIIPPGESTIITVNVKRDNLEQGSHDVFFYVTSIIPDAMISAMVKVKIDVDGAPILATNTDKLSYDYFESVKTVEISNTGNSVLSWELEDLSDTHLSTTNLSGSLAEGEKDYIIIYLDRENLETQTHEEELTFHTNAGDYLLPVEINHFHDTKLHLNGRVKTAEYNIATDQIIAITQSPAQILKIDPEAGTVESIDLDYKARQLSISPDGQYAIVGCGNEFHKIELSSMEIVNTFDWSVYDSDDLVYGPNEMAYIASNSFEHTHLLNYDMKTGDINASLYWYLDNEINMKLAPDGELIYAATTDESPARMFKFDTQYDSVSLLYPSTENGLHAFAEEFWYSSDGSKIYTKNKNVFTASTDEATDLKYLGQINGSDNIQTLAHSSTCGKLYMIFNKVYGKSEKPDTYISVYYDDPYIYDRKIDLEEFISPNGSGGATFKPAYGWQGFMNSAGTRYYIIIKNDYLIPDEWSVLSYDVE